MQRKTQRFSLQFCLKLISISVCQICYRNFYKIQVVTAKSKKKGTADSVYLECMGGKNNKTTETLGGSILPARETNATLTASHLVSICRHNIRTQYDPTMILSGDVGSHICSVEWSRFHSGLVYGHDPSQSASFFRHYGD